MAIGTPGGLDLRGAGLAGQLPFQIYSFCQKFLPIAGF
jgi:hypothetical protein